MKPDISSDFPAKPTPDQLTEAVRTCVLALIYSWSIPPEEGENSASKVQIAEFFGIEVDSPELECLGLFDEWG
jgi:hypothetical protein